MDSTPPYARLTLKRHEDRRILAGHPWVFSNEIRDMAGSPKQGDIVELRDAGGVCLGYGFYHPHSLIAFRFLSATPETIDTEFFTKRIANAQTLRQKLFPGSTFYRLVHGEGDFLPGLVIDRFNEHFVVQTLAAGMDSRLEAVCDAIESLFHPVSIVERNESGLRTLEQLPPRKGALRGTPAPTRIVDEGVQFIVDPLGGQKTGFFLDQRLNRMLVRQFANGARVLDCFCNDGGFALHAAAGGATSVLGLDSSADAIQRATRNAEINNAAHVSFRQNDVFDALAGTAATDNRFDMIILDPPSFAKNKKNVATAKKGYRDLHRAAFLLLERGGFLATASCSHHILPETFLDVVNSTARDCDRRLQQVFWRGASPDHPVLPGVPETHYLKFALFRVE
ncbi:MAG: Fmu (Sun) domain protein [Bacteroidetes bacterium]|nr:Fmu (Sun) domain protein [Bacteroidota bacterium]